ncbi:MAG: glycosyltransferase [Desulforhopalus sp.]|nr:glycosyltransferase [Desulforhopalus sp.]
MKIRIVTLASFPEGLAATSRIRCYAKALQEQGDDVEVVSPKNIHLLPGRCWLFEGESEGIRFRLLCNREAKGGLWKRYLRAYMEPIVLSLYTIATMWQCDVFFIYANTAMSRFLMMLLLRVGGKKIVLELNEYPYATEGSRITRLPGVSYFLRAFVLHAVFPLANGFIVISQALEDVAKRYAPKTKKILVPILTEHLPSPSPKRKAGTEEVYLFHAGSLSEQKDGILAVFDAFSMAHQMLNEQYGIRLKFFLTNKVTQSSTWEGIVRILAKHGLHDAIVITGFCPERNLQGLMSGALAHIINKPKSFQNHYNFPTKLGSCLASGRPVIFAAEGLEANRYLVDGDNAFVVAPDDSEKMAKAVVRCYHERELGANIGKRGMETVEQHFHYGRHALRMNKFIRSL